MGSKKTNRPVYDGNACLLYDFMIKQKLTEEVISERMGLVLEKGSKTPWQPIATWIQYPNSIPSYRIPLLCRVLNAPMEAIYIKSFILNEIKIVSKDVQTNKLLDENIGESGFHETIRSMRKSKGISLQEMASLLGLKTASAYYKKETGAIPLTLEEARVLSEYFKKPLEKIYV